MAIRVSTQAAGIVVLIFAVLSWVAVLVELALLGFAEIVSLTTALMFTALLVGWPWLAGGSLWAKPVPSTQPCGQCGELPLPIFDSKFCVHCGAYPKAKSRPKSGASA